MAGKHGWHSGKGACLSPLWPGFNSWARCHMWVEFVVDSLPCFKGFSPGFLPPKKSKFLNSNSILNQGPDWKQAFGFICYPHKTKLFILFIFKIGPYLQDSAVIWYNMWPENQPWWQNDLHNQKQHLTVSILAKFEHFLTFFMACQLCHSL
jgi:hypothetical protein